LPSSAPLRAHRCVLPAKVRTDIGAAFVQHVVEFAERCDNGRAARDATCELGEHLLQLGLAFALVLIVLLEEEDEQRDADADQDHAKLRKDVAVIFQQLFAMAHVVAHTMGYAQIDEQREYQQSRADQDEPADQEVAMARAEIHSCRPKTPDSAD